MGGKAGSAPIAAPQQPQFQMPSFEMPSFESQSSDYEAQAAQRAAEVAEAAETKRLADGAVNRDDAYGAYLDAAGSATDYVNNEIDKQAANAALLGIDYEVNDEQKSQRINDYFASIWGEGDQAKLEGYMTDFGDPEGFDGFSVSRGDGSKYEGTEGSETLVTSTKTKTGGTSTSSILTDDEDQLGATGTTTLGGA